MDLGYIRSLILSQSAVLLRFKMPNPVYKEAKKSLKKGLQRVEQTQETYMNTIFSNGKRPHCCKQTGIFLD